MKKGRVGTKARKRSEKKYGANVLIKGHRCYRCKSAWIPRSKKLPKVCPKCNSPYWNKPRER